MSEPIFSRVPLAELCTLKNGYGFEPKDWSDYGLPIIRIQNLNGGSDFNYFAGRPPVGYVVNPGDLLFAWSGNRGTSFGPFIWRGPRGLLNQHIFKVTPKPEVPQAWLYHALHIARDKAERQAHGGSGLVHVKRAELLSFEIPTPPPHQLDKLARILDAVDRAIEQTEALITKYQCIKTGLMQDLLTRGIDEHGHLRRAQKEAPQLYKTSNVGRIPSSWDVCHLKDIAVITRLAGYEYSTFWEEREDGEITVLRGFNIGKNEIIDRDLTRISDNLSRKLIRSRLFAGDVVFPCVGTIGNAVMIKESDKYHINQNIAKISPGPRVDALFLTHFLMSPFCKAEIDKFNASSSQPNVLVGSLRQFQIRLPRDVEEQKEIANLLSEQDELSKTTQKTLEKLGKLKTGLMQDLLTGNVSVELLQDTQTGN